MKARGETENRKTMEKTNKIKNSSLKKSTKLTNIQVRLSKKKRERERQRERERERSQIIKFRNQEETSQLTIQK